MIETLEGRSVEAGVTVLDHAILVLNPHEHMVRVEDVLALLTLFVVTETQGVVTLVIGLAVDGLEDVLRVILEHPLGSVGQRVRVILVLLVKLLVRCGAILGKGGRVHGVAVSGRVATVLVRPRGNDALVRAAGLEPHAARNGVRNVGLGRGPGNWALRVLNELVALGGHPAVFVARRNFLVESRHQLDVAVSYTEGAERTLNEAIEGTWHEAIGLAEHDNLVAALVGERLNPDAVLLVSAGRPGVLLAELIGPGDALITRTEREGTLTAVTTDDVRKGVGLRAEDRRVRAVLILELRVYSDTIHWDVAIVDRGTRVTLWAGQVHVTRDQALTNTVRVGQVSGLRDTTTRDHVSVDDLIIRGSLRRQHGSRSLSSLSGSSVVQDVRNVARRHGGSHSQSQGGRTDSHRLPLKDALRNPLRHELEILSCIYSRPLPRMHSLTQSVRYGTYPHVASRNPPQQKLCRHFWQLEQGIAQPKPLLLIVASQEEELRMHV